MKKLAYLIGFTALAIGSAAAAQTTSVEINANTQNSAEYNEAETESNTTTEASAETNASPIDSLENNIEAGIDTAAIQAQEISAEAQAEAQAALDAAAELYADVKTETAAALTIAGNELRSEATLNVNSATEVNTEEEFVAYVQSNIGSDENLESVVVTENTVAMTYMVPVQLFGFIDTSMNKTFTVTRTNDDSLVVDVDKAWWAFAATGDNEVGMQTAIETSVGEMELSNENTLTVREQAMVLENMYVGLNAESGTQVSLR